MHSHTGAQLSHSARAMTHVCALSIMGARRPGIDVETRVVSVFRYQNGQQTERWFHPEDPAAWDRIFEDQTWSFVRADTTESSGRDARPAPEETQ